MIQRAQRARLCFGRLSDKLFFVRHDAGDEDFMIHDLVGCNTGASEQGVVVPL